MLLKSFNVLESFGSNAEILLNLFLKEKSIEEKNRDDLMLDSNCFWKLKLFRILTESVSELQNH